MAGPQLRSSDYVIRPGDSVGMRITHNIFYRNRDTGTEITPIGGARDGYFQSIYSVRTSHSKIRLNTFRDTPGCIKFRSGSNHNDFTDNVLSKAGWASTVARGGPVYENEQGSPLEAASCDNLIRDNKYQRDFSCHYITAGYTAAFRFAWTNNDGSGTCAEGIHFTGTRGWNDNPRDNQTYSSISQDCP
jgi:hypothetical protein